MENLTRVSFATSWKCLSEGRNGGGLMLVGSVCGLTRPHMHAVHTQTHKHTHVCIEPSVVVLSFPVEHNNLLYVEMIISIGFVSQLK